MHVIMLIEDDDDIRESVAALIEAEGFSVLTAANGEDALMQLRNGARPSLIILDLMMPVMDGWQFCAEQRADLELAPIPIVIASSDPDVREHTAALGVADFLIKPIELAALLNRIERHCQRPGRRVA